MYKWICGVHDFKYCYHFHEPSPLKRFLLEGLREANNSPFLFEQVIRCFLLNWLVKWRWLDFDLIQHYYGPHMHLGTQTCIGKNLANIQLSWVNKHRNDPLIISAEIFQLHLLEESGCFTILMKTHHQIFQYNYKHKQKTNLDNIDAIFRMWSTSVTTDLQEHFYFISSKHTFLPTETVNWICAVTSNLYTKPVSVYWSTDRSMSYFGLLSNLFIAQSWLTTLHLVRDQLSLLVFIAWNGVGGRAGELPQYTKGGSGSMIIIAFCL